MSKSGEASAKHPSCGQCGRPAIMEVGGVPLCVDCTYKFRQGQWMAFAENAAMLNHADAQMCAVVGMPQLRTPIEIPKAPVPPIHFNNQSVTVSGGNVGAINFGTVGDIQVNIKTLTEQGEIGVAEQLASLTNAVLEAGDANESQKNELLEQVAFLASQASAKPEERKPGAIKAVAGAIKETAATVGSIASAWGAVQPLLNGHFGLAG